VGFNELLAAPMVRLRRRKRAVGVTVSILLMAAIGFSSLPASPQAPAASSTKGLTAAQKQGVARMKAAWKLAGGVKSFVFGDLDPNGIPLLLVDRRPGRKPWALLMQHPSPPKDFTIVEAASDEGPAIVLGPPPVLAPAARSPYTFSGAPTALYLLGESLPDGPFGEEPGERVLSRIVHEMVHVHALKKGLPAEFAPAAATISSTPELLAMTAVENRIILAFLYADSGKVNVLEDLARQFVAVRRARWMLMGPASDVERRIELSEGTGVYVEAQIFRWFGNQMMEPPQGLDDDPSYHGYQYSLIWRLGLLLERFVAHPSDSGALAARAPYAGASQLMMIDRLGKAPPDMPSRVFKPDTVVVDILSERVPMEGTTQDETLNRAREIHGYRAALALARRE
jgi:hypothetical protein